MKQPAFLLLTFLTCFANAQNTAYFMERLPQNVLVNPAFNPKVRFFLGLPGLGGVSAQAYNSGFNYLDFDEFNENLKQDGFNPDNFIQSIGDYNNFIAETRANIFMLGFALKDIGYFSFHANINNTTRLNAESDIVYLFSDYDNLGAGKFPLTINKLNLFTNTYLSVGFTYSRKINEHLTLGISPHLNGNLAGIQSRNINYTVRMDDSQTPYREYDETFSGEVIVGLPNEINPEAIDGNEFDLDAGLMRQGWEEDLKLSDLFRNKTLSVDLGATYFLNEWLLTASILNIGASKWKTNGYVLNGDSDTEKIFIRENEKIKIGIPPKIYLGVNRKFSPKWNYGLLLTNTFYNSGSDASATLSLNGYVGSALSTSVSYTAGYKFDNLGLGLRLRFFPGMDLIFVTDNVVQALNYKRAYRMSATAGINLSFGVKDKIASANEPIL
jgi:hypothetical protein